MGLLSQVLRPRERRAVDWKGNRVWGWGETPAGVEVTPTSAMAYSAVFACVRVIAEDVGVLPLILYRRMEGRGKTRAEDHPLYRLLRWAPNPEMTAMEFREVLTGHVAVWGNGYAEKEYDRGGRLMGLWPLRPDRMRPQRVGGRLVYEYTLPDGEKKMLGQEQVMHLRGFGGDGVSGYSPVGLMRNAVGLGLAAEEFGSRFFGNGARPQLVLIHPETLSPEAQENLRRSWTRQHEGLGNSHRVAVLEEGIKLEQVGIPPEDAQFLQTRRFQALEIARIYRVPPHKIQDLERATFSNIEHQSIEYVASTLAPWLVRWEQAISRDLLGEGERERLFAEHLVEGMLRGDTLSRYQAYSIGRQNGWLSANDVRERENMNPIEGGDEYLSPLNMVPVGAGEEERGQGPGARGQGGGKTNYELRTTNYEKRAVGEGRRKLMAAHREVFRDAMARVVRRETNDVRQAAGRMLGRRDVGSFRVWVDEFYREFEGWLVESLGPLYRSYGRVMADSAAREIGGDGEALDVEAWAAGYVGEFAGRHARKSKRKLDEALALAVEEGVDDLTAVEGALDGWRESWPEYLAGRETVLAGNAATAATFEANGKTRFRWNTSLGPHVCDFCLEMEGQEVEIGEQFAAEGLPDFRGVDWPPLHDGCLPGDSLVAPGGRVAASSERWFDGDVVVITTAAGNKLTCTPNHPVLADGGWVAAGALDVGDHVISDRGFNRELALGGDDQDVPARIHDVAKSFCEAGEMIAVPMPVTAEHFHGDGANSEVAVIRADRRLLGEFDAPFQQKGGQGAFVGGDAGAVGLAGLGGPAQGLEVGSLAASGLMGGGDLGGAFDGRAPLPDELLGVGHSARLDAVFEKAAVNDAAIHAQFLGECLLGDAGEVFLDEVVLVERNEFHGYVYNLQTETGYYVAEGIVTHNCECVIVAG